MVILKQFVFLSLLVACARAVVISISTSELSGLEYFFNSTNGTEWDWRNGNGSAPHWEFNPVTTDPCGSNPWQGLKCSCPSTDNCTVVSILLADYNLTGTVPSEVSLLPNLLNFDVSGNNVAGSDLSYICGLPMLKSLQMNGCGLSGSLPSCLVNLSFLEILRLSMNMLSGSIPEDIGLLSNLEVLNLESILVCSPENSKRIPDLAAFGNSYCSSVTNVIDLVADYDIAMSGTLPTSLCQLGSLGSFDMAFQRISGSIPSCIGSISSLTGLAFPGNMLHGSIPSQIGQLTSLLLLYLDTNRLSSTIPPTIGQLDRLRTLTMNLNVINGSLPSNLCNLSNLQGLALGSNNFSGSIPSCVGQLGVLTVLDLVKSNITGTIPEGIMNMSALQKLYLDLNDLNGTIPTSIAKLANLMTIGLNRNKLTGSIPAELPLSLQHIWLQANSLTGVVPARIGCMTQLYEIVLDDNFLSHSLPDSLGSLTTCVYLNVSFNKLSGTVPSSMRGMLAMSYLYLDENQFTGSGSDVLNFVGPQVVDLELSQNSFSGKIPFDRNDTANLKDFYIRENFFTGSFPNGNQVQEYALLSNISKLDFGSNRFSGTLPSSLQLLKYLEVLIVSGNKLSGNLYELFDNSTFNDHLKTVDVAGNQLTGSLPEQLFSSPSLTQFAGGSNCFTGSISSALCNASSLITLDISGMVSGEQCGGLVWWFGIPVNMKVSGDIPACLLGSASLEVLSMSGNNVRSTLSDLAPNSRMRYLTLSNNHIYGTIPESFKQHLLFNKLDLGFNHISGTLDGSLWFPANHSHSQVNLRLKSNRLSGDIPSSFLNASVINILDGNLFQCEQMNPSTLPANDPQAHNYICGSSVLDSTLYMTVTIIFIRLVLTAIFMFGVSTDNPVHTYIVQLFSMLFGDRNRASSGNPFVDILGDMLATLRFGSFKIVLASLIILIPLYLSLKLSKDGFSSHTYEYAWTLSLGYMNGAQPAYIMMAFMASILVLFVLSDIRVSRKLRDMAEPEVELEAKRVSVAKSGLIEQPVSVPAVSTLEDIFLSKPSLHFYTFSINFVIMFGVNGAYVYFVLGRPVYQQYLMAFGLSVFKIGWTSGFISPILVSLKAKARLILIVYLLNNIVIPILGSLCIDINCYQTIFLPSSAVPNDLIVQQYQCSLGVENLYYSGECEYTPYLISSSFEPMFSYSEQCGSSVLSNYIHVYLIMMGVVNSIILVCQFGIFSYFCDIGTPSNANDVSRAALVSTWKKHIMYYKAITAGIINKRVLPIQKDDDFSLLDDHNRMYNLREFAVGFAVSVVLMLTFGMAYPPLNVIIFIEIVSISLLQQLLIGHHHRQLQNFPEKLAAWTTSLIVEVEQLRDVLYTPKPINVVFCASFMSIFLYDMAVATDGEIAWGITFTMISWSCLVAILYHFYEERIKEHKFTQQMLSFVRSRSSSGIQMVHYLKSVSFGSWRSESVTADWPTRPAPAAPVGVGVGVASEEDVHNPMGRNL